MTLDEAKTYLGNKHLLHPDNQIRKKPKPLSSMEKYSVVCKLIRAHKCASLSEIPEQGKAQ